MTSEVAEKSLREPAISIVIPTFNEADTIEGTLRPLQKYRRCADIEIILSDGDSHDLTREVVQPLVDVCINETKGRARQMNAGASMARGELLLFLHADTVLPDGFCAALTDQLCEHSGRLLWGFYPVRLSGKHRLLRVVERLMNCRSRLTSIATGDQGIYVSKDLWAQLEGFSDIPLMEDIDLSRRLRRLARPVVQGEPLSTSSRRWESRGIIKTIVLMWRLRWLYFRGVNPSELVKLYR